MLSLDDPIWETFLSAYNIPYNVAIPLKKLKAATDKQEVDLIWRALFDNLYHQDDVNTASYMAIPHLIEIAKEKRLDNFKYLTFITLVEKARRYNPPVPPQFEEDYFHALEDSITLIDFKQIKNWTRSYTVVVLMLLSILSQKPDIADVLEHFEDTELVEKFDAFMEGYLG